MHSLTQDVLKKKRAPETVPILWNLNSEENAVREDELTPWLALHSASVSRRTLTTSASCFSSSFVTFNLLDRLRLLVNTLTTVQHLRKKKTKKNTNRYFFQTLWAVCPVSCKFKNWKLELIVGVWLRSNCAFWKSAERPRMFIYERNKDGKQAK